MTDSQRVDSRNWTDDRFFEAIAQLEALGKAGKLAKAPELLGELKSKLKRLLEDLDKEWPRK